ncbi:MAG: TonB-dependent receptor [Saprospiraceae bacterium]|nr:TonB-dependent receptor [Saprospiraceae bacterium]
MKIPIIYLFLVFSTSCLIAQNGTIQGVILNNNGQVLPFANIILKEKNVGKTSDTEGGYIFENTGFGTHTLITSAIGFVKSEQKIVLTASNHTAVVTIKLIPNDEQLSEVVVTGTMKEVRRSESPAPIEVYSAKFFLKNPTPNLFESLSNVNGVRPQLNCNVCSTGDIHINGMEGAYTMVMIDGTPIVSGLSTVYGLLGIPASMIDRLEVVKGPASTLYGSEAVGGLINVITKTPHKAPILSFDVSATSYAELNNDLSAKMKLGNATTFFSANYFNLDKRWDINKDNFTDITLAKRASLFNKWAFARADGKRSDVAFRYVWEDRFGGELQWSKQFYGTDSIYGENIRTNRFEVVGTQDFGKKQNFRLQYSYNRHNQQSAYGTTIYNADQQIGFAQLSTQHQIGVHDWLFGAAMRYTFYDDNTTATADFLNPSVNQPSRVYLPGIFVQDEISLNQKNKILAGLRFDYNSEHGTILTPRFNYKWTPTSNHTLRLSYGNGFRVANIFSEDHAALTGARQVEIAETLEPERSHNINVNYITKFFPSFGFIGLDASLFWTYFDNKILADYDTDPNKIIYDNLKGYGISQGLTLNTDFNLKNGFKIVIGTTLMDVFTKEQKDLKVWQIQTPRFTSNWSASYSTPKNGWVFDLTGSTTSPMRLPILPNDYRPELSPWFSIVNVQAKKTINASLEIYGGVKNLFNFLPKNPIIRASDPFDKRVNESANPLGYTFDPSYNYAPMQGIRGFLGIRYVLP